MIYQTDVGILIIELEISDRRLINVAKGNSKGCRSCCRVLCIANQSVLCWSKEPNVGTCEQFRLRDLFGLPQFDAEKVSVNFALSCTVGGEVNCRPIHL